MAHYYERDRVHAQQTPGRRTVHPPMARPGPGPSTPSSRIDCDSCPVAGHGCAGCMVALLGPVRLRLDGAEQRVVDNLVDAGLVEAAEARTAHAVPDLPDWMLQARVTGGDASTGNSGTGNSGAARPGPEVRTA